MRKIFFINVIYCQTFVSPGTGATLQTYKNIVYLFALHDSGLCIGAGEPKYPTDHLFGAQRVDDGRLADIGVADKANGDVLLIGAQAGQLAQQREQAALAKGVGDAGVKGESWVLLAQRRQPPLGDPGRDLRGLHLVHITVATRVASMEALQGSG